MSRGRCVCGALCGCVALAVGALVISQLSAAAPQKPAGGQSSIGRRMPHLILSDAQGTERTWADWRDKQAIVMAFVGTTCPVANRYLPILADLQKRFQDRKVQVLLVYANPSDTPAKIAEHVAKFQVTLPALHDAEQLALEASG